MFGSVQSTCSVCSVCLPAQSFCVGAGARDLVHVWPAYTLPAQLPYAGATARGIVRICLLSRSALEVRSRGRLETKLATSCGTQLTHDWHHRGDQHLFYLSKTLQHQWNWTMAHVLRGVRRHEPGELFVVHTVEKQ